MYRRLILVLPIALLSLPAWAQIKLRLELPSKGPFQVWVGDKVPQGSLPEATSIEGPSGEFSPGSFGPSDKLFVLDESTGNLAIKPMSQIQGSLKLSQADFASIARITVRVEHKGQPVESASVSLKSGKDSRTQLLDSSSQGETTFYAVPPGQIQVAVQYRTADGQTPEPIKQASDVKLQRSRLDVTLIVSIPDEVATIAAASNAGSTKSGEGKSEERVERGGMGFLGRLISFILAVGIAALLVYFGLKWMKSNQDQVQAKLSSLGVEIPGQNQEPPADAHVARAPIAPPPPEKIMLDDAAPTPLSAPVAMGTATITEPKLVSEDGSQIPLDEGSITVGRDAGMGLSLLNESTVSRQHAELIRTGQSVVLKDLGSTNGTFVNGQKVDGEVELRPGDKVQFGAVRFRFEG